MNGKKAVIFDLDGTLLDTITDIAVSMNAVLARNGYPVHDIQTYLTFVGHGLDILVRLALPDTARDEQTIRGILGAMREEYALRWHETSKPYPGIPELLTVLSAKGMKLAVLSNKLEAFTREMVSTLLASWEFFQVRGIDTGKPRKPNPTQAMEIAGGMGLSPSQILFVGDSEMDMETAKRAGMYHVGVLWGYQSRDQLIAGGAEALIEKPGDLLAYV